MARERGEKGKGREEVSHTGQVLGSYKEISNVPRKLHVTKPLETPGSHCFGC